jgi:hypothetical protein
MCGLNNCATTAWRLTPKHSQYFLRQEDLRQWQPVRWPLAFEAGSAVTRGLHDGTYQLHTVHTQRVFCTRM